MAAERQLSLPPHDSLQAALSLAFTPGVGPKIRMALVERFGSPEAVLAASPQQWRETPGVGAKLANNLANAQRDFDLEALLQLCQKEAVDLLVHGLSDRYPQRLQEIDDPPPVLFCQGEVLPQDALAVAIVGTRHATQYGKKQAENLAAGLARAGVTVISGLARGIDAAAHRGALQAGGRTLAVLGGGVLKMYPPEHRELAEEVRKQGALLSETPPDVPPAGGNFPRRNRIISGMSLGVLVVEAAERSGSLITAEHAASQNRDVFAVPGRVDTPVARGCHGLIREGAKLVESVDDILEELGPVVQTTPVGERTVRRPAELQLNEQEQQIFAAIDSEPTSIDRVASQAGLPIHRVLATINVLEMRRLIRKVSGNYVVRS